MRSKLDDVTLIESDISCSMMSFIQNLKNKTYQTKPNNPNLPNQTEETITKIKFTKPNLAKLNIELLIELKHESKVLNPWVLCAFGNVLQNQTCHNDKIIIPFVLSYAQMAEARCSKGAKKLLQIEVPLSYMRFNDVFEIT